MVESAAGCPQLSGHQRGGGDGFVMSGALSRLLQKTDVYTSLGGMEMGCSAPVPPGLHHRVDKSHGLGEGCSGLSLSHTVNTCSGLSNAAALWFVLDSCCHETT